MTLATDLDVNDGLVDPLLQSVREQADASPGVRVPEPAHYPPTAGNCSPFADSTWWGLLIATANTVERQLKRLFAQLDATWVHDAVVDAVWDLQNRAHEAPMCVRSALYQAAYRNACNAATSERAARQRERRWYDNYVATLDQETPDQADRSCEHACARIVALLPDEEMRTIFRLCADGERQTSVFASALGLSNLEPAEQCRRIKRAKDRMKKYVSRHEVIRAIGRAAVTPGGRDADDPCEQHYS
jgi:hypothetical protein